MINLHTYLFTFNVHEFVLILKLGASGLKLEYISQIPFAVLLAKSTVMALSNAEAPRNAIPLCGERTWGCNLQKGL